MLLWMTVFLLKSIVHCDFLCVRVVGSGYLFPYDFLAHCKVIKPTSPQWRCFTAQGWGPGLMRDHEASWVKTMFTFFVYFFNKLLFMASLLAQWLWSSPDNWLYFALVYFVFSKETHVNKDYWCLMSQALTSQIHYTEDDYMSHSMKYFLKV